MIDTYSTLNFYYALFVSWLARRIKLDYIPILHGGNLVSRLKSSPILSRSIFRKALVNVSPSKFLKLEFEKLGYDNVKYIPNFLNLDNYPFVKKEYNSIKLLWVRSLATIYNPEQAIFVAEQLNDKGYDVELCMVGPDSENKMNKLKDLAFEKRLKVKFTGKLPKKAWIDLSKDYNVFLNTTSIDNMPVSVLEAMALGFPVVSTNVGGMPYLIEQNQDGVLVQPNNPVAMTDAILGLIENPDKLKRISKNARQKAETFDWTQVKHLWIDLLETHNSKVSR